MSTTPPKGQKPNSAEAKSLAAWPLFLMSAWTMAQNNVLFSPIITPVDEDLTVPPEWDLEQMAANSPATFTMPDALANPMLPASYEPPTAFKSGEPVGETTWDKYLEHLIDREGYSRTVYADSLGKPTVGVGHLVKDGETYKIGDQVSDLEVRALLESDAKNGYKAAIDQANELGINDSNFVVALGSVNFQLGTNWRQKFPQTWQAMKDGDYDQAISNLEQSRWNKQTPVRVADFQEALKNAKTLKQTPSHLAEAEKPDKPSLSGTFDQQAAGTAVAVNNPDYEGPVEKSTPAATASTLQVS